ncbi:MAG: protein kinase, partial [Planctomycetes bacterium]|nr:protein kinase [Planctomycetota bacterium]
RIADAGSSSGTWVNGEKVTDQLLQSGDQIALGDTRLRFDAVSLSAAATVPPQETGPPQETAPSQESVPAEETTRPSDSKPVVEEPVKSAPVPDAGARGKPSRPREHDLSKLIGRTLEGYTLNEIVSRASSGMVFRGTAIDGGRTVAVKVLWPELLTRDEDTRRFVRAVRTMQPIRHDNLVTLFDGGCTDEGFCWCAMEWIEGETAENAIGRIGIAGMLDWKYAIRVAHGVACALETLHEHQIVHRNILPRNIIIREKDGRVKLGDLILAKALDGAQSEKITRQGEIIGELGYLAPEQLAGGDHVDCRSDMYNLGATVYALLAGRPPFDGDNPAEIIRGVQRDRPVLPTNFQLSIPPLLESAILKMLAKRPDDRFALPSRLVIELERVARYQGMDSLQ